MNQMHNRLVISSLGALFGILILGTSCTKAYIQSVGGEMAQTFERIYATDLNTAWQSVQEALKNNQLDVTNREGGIIITKWIDNTVEKNFASSFGSTSAYLKAQYRFHITVSKGYYNGRSAIKVSLHKEQVVQKDALEGWKAIPTDSVDEMTLLYRIGRIVSIKNRLAKEEEDRIKRDMRQSENPAKTSQ